MTKYEKRRNKALHQWMDEHSHQHIDGVEDAIDLGFEMAIEFVNKKCILRANYNQDRIKDMLKAYKDSKE